MIYYYKGKPYTIVAESKMKIKALIDYGYLECNMKLEHMDRWVDVIIYQCEYENPEGRIWVRLKEQFFELFKTQE